MNVNDEFTYLAIALLFEDNMQYLSIFHWYNIVWTPPSTFSFILLKKGGGVHVLSIKRKEFAK